MSRKILVLGETRESSLRNVSFEAIAAELERDSALQKTVDIIMKNAREA